MQVSATQAAMNPHSKRRSCWHKGGSSRSPHPAKTSAAANNLGSSKQQPTAKGTCLHDFLPAGAALHPQNHFCLPQAQLLGCLCRRLHALCRHACLGAICRSGKGEQVDGRGVQLQVQRAGSGPGLTDCVSVGSIRLRQRQAGLAPGSSSSSSGSKCCSSCTAASAH